MFSQTALMMFKIFWCISTFSAEQLWDLTPALFFPALNIPSKQLFLFKCQNASIFGLCSSELLLTPQPLPSLNGLLSNHKQMEYLYVRFLCEQVCSEGHFHSSPWGLSTPYSPSVNTHSVPRGCRVFVKRGSAHLAVFCMAWICRRKVKIRTWVSVSVLWGYNSMA